MSIISVNFVNGSPNIPVKVGVSDAYHRKHGFGGRKSTRRAKVMGLIDTGANCTCIDPSVLDFLHLIPTNITPISTPSTDGTPLDCYGYEVSLTLNGLGRNYTIKHIEVIGAPVKQHGENFAVLIGRDVLKKGVLVYNGVLEKLELVMT